MASFNKITLNFSRFENIKRIIEVWEKLNYNLNFLCFQEINVESVIHCSEKDLNVIVNWYLNLSIQIGIATLIISVKDKVGTKKIIVLDLNFLHTMRNNCPTWGWAEGMFIY